MSSFVVSANTMNRIITFLDDITSGSSIHKSTYKDLLTKYRIVPVADPRAFDFGLDEKTLQRLTNTLWDLNIEAVHQRYPDDKPNEMPGSYENQKLVHHTPYEYTPTTTIQAYKSLQCLVYQCSEGNVPNNPLYKMLEELEGVIAKQIVYDLAEYDKAEWD